MTQQEFTKRTGLNVTSVMFEEINNEYMRSQLDKDAFCRSYKKRSFDVTKDLVRQINDLKQLQGITEVMKYKERKHNELELTKAYKRIAIYAAEIIRLRGLDPSDDNAVRQLFKDLNNKSTY